MIRTIFTLAVLAALLCPAALSAQGLLINVAEDQVVRLPRPIIIWPPYPPQPPRPTPPPVEQGAYKIKELAVNVRLDEQVAKVQVSQSFVNTSSQQMEVCFVFPLPYDGAVDQLTLMVDGKEFPAKLLEAKEARKLYEDIVRKNKDPALLEWMGTGMFKTSVFPVPAGAERKVTLRYSQLCRNFEGLTDFLIPLSTAKYTSHPVEKVSIDLTVESKAEIKNVYSPSHKVEIKRPDNKHATISFSSTNEVPTADFRLLYDVGKGQVQTSVISYRPKADDDGYFLLLTSPEVKPANEQPAKKTVLFVVDRSGSMSGDKINQAKGAVKFVLNNLKEGDLFNVIAYDSAVESWKAELQKFNDETRNSALGFVEGIYAGGSTNISGALQAALTQLKDDKQPTYVLFMTDGLPTEGETNEAKIVLLAEEHNKVRGRLFAFGVGYDVNSRLLDKLVRENHGQSEYVRPNENIEDRVSKFYARIGSPVLTDVTMTFDLEGVKVEDGNPINRFYPKETQDLFAGEQLVIVGRYKKPGAAKVVLKGKVGDQEQKFDFPATLVEKSADDSQAFIEKLWAVRRVGEIIDEIDLKGKNDELVKELVALATQHGILTPYTSFLADENANVRDLAGNFDRAESRLAALRESGGQSGFAQRAAKGAYQRASAAPAADALLDESFTEADAAVAGGATAGPGAVATNSAGTFQAALPARGTQSARQRITRAVRVVGRKSFYREGEQWVDSALTEEQQKKPEKIERFSDRYFELVDKHGGEVAKYLTFDEPVVVEIDGQAYSF